MGNYNKTKSLKICNKLSKQWIKLIDWQRKLMAKESWLAKKVNWQRKLIVEGNRLMNLGFDCADI